MPAASAAPAAVATAPTIQEITWHVPNIPSVAGGTAEDSILAKGAACELRFTSAQHPIRQMLPSLPWKWVPGHPGVLAPYLPIATISWAMFFLSKSTRDMKVDSHILTAAAIDRVWKRAVSLDLPLLPTQMGLAIVAVSTFVEENYHTDFDLQATDLEATEGPPRSDAGCAAPPIAHVGGLTFSHMSARITARSSLVPMCVFEYLTGPRTLGKGIHSRFKVGSQFCKVFFKLFSRRTGYHHAHKHRNAYLEHASEFFSSLAVFHCPVTLLDFDFSSCTSACTKRMLDMDTIIEWTQKPGTRTSIVKRGFYTYVQSWEELSLVVLPAQSSAEAFDRADRLRKELMPLSTAMGDSITPLNDLVRDLHARNCIVRVHTPSTWMTAKEHDDLNASTAIALTPTNTTSNSACPNAIGLVHETRRDDASLSGNNPTCHRSRRHSKWHTHTPRDTDPNSPTRLYPRYTTVQFRIPQRLETWTQLPLAWGSLLV